MKKHTDFSRTLYKIVACATLLLTVGVFLERSGKYYVGAEAGGERKHVCTSLEEAKKLADQNAVYGWSVFDFNGRLVYTTYSPLAAEILREAKTITDYVREEGFTYGDAPINPAIDCSAKKVSCDSRSRAAFLCMRPAEIRGICRRGASGTALKKSRRSPSFSRATSYSLIPKQRRPAPYMRGIRLFMPGRESAAANITAMTAVWMSVSEASSRPASRF